MQAQMAWILASVASSIGMGAWNCKLEALEDEQVSVATAMRRQSGRQGWTKSSLSWLGGSVQKYSDWTHLSFKIKMTSFGTTFNFGSAL
jgi:hypothetical protein